MAGNNRFFIAASLGIVLAAMAASAFALLSYFVLSYSSPPSRAAVEPVWGMFGGYQGIDTADLYKRGVRLAVIEMEWAEAEPAEGSFSSSYFSRQRDLARSLRAQGYKVVLNFGMHHAPDWLLSRPNARFVNQHGRTYTDSNEPNLVWETGLRPAGERYTARVFQELGTDFYAVRVGGGHWGELTYPQIFRADGRLENYYWAYDAAASRTNPVPGWKPGMASPNGEARRFANWYMNGLTSYQNWQISTLRKSYPGTIAVLYASWGLRDGDFERAVATNLNGTSSSEINGEMQRGFDHGRHIAAITDPNIAVWGTWAEREGTLSWLAGLADAKGFKKMAENSGQDNAVIMADAVKHARKHNLEAFLWIRASEAYCRCNGYATIDDYQRLIAAAPPTVERRGDLNQDGSVTIVDLSILLSRWGGQDVAADLNGDGSISIKDLSILLSNWSG